MRRVEISKGTGRGVRVIYACTEAETARLRRHLPVLEAAVARACPDAWGCVPGRSPTSAARQHAARRWTLGGDFRGFFDHCRVADAAAELRRLGCDPTAEPWASALAEGQVGGVPVQGLATSPALANLCAAALDRDVRAWLRERDPAAIYTRYVDDIAVSSDDRDVCVAFRSALPGLAARHGHEAHPAKWTLQSARAGRRVICGVAIEDDGSPHATREARRRLRAARHRAPESGQARGLAEWVAQHEPDAQVWAAAARAVIPGPCRVVVCDVPDDHPASLPRVRVDVARIYAWVAAGIQTPRPPAGPLPHHGDTCVADVVAAAEVGPVTVVLRTPVIVRRWRSRRHAESLRDGYCDAVRNAVPLHEVFAGAVARALARGDVAAARTNAPLRRALRSVAVQAGLPVAAITQLSAWDAADSLAEVF